ncbi:hypothetical protein H0A36_19645 [Endozoicomonas sp. SM1973]|uniref:Uncharacterized protein n=1 Tax=Spartinivicinus marinus TaxID=2994442 RepID=A0A853IGG3_9GAMM|nr:hypothetical protein [Spartinivicinus marinus]MCX4027959.1 hypothetical protein [Spartinivicinus marinus]NYZ68235.1 hypothetical protein [Spartinivicinus marinus]
MSFRVKPWGNFQEETQVAEIATQGINKGESNDIIQTSTGIYLKPIKEVQKAVILKEELNYLKNYVYFINQHSKLIIDHLSACLNS